MSEGMATMQDNEEGSRVAMAEGGMNRARMESSDRARSDEADRDSVANGEGRCHAKGEKVIDRSPFQVLHWRSTMLGSAVTSRIFNSEITFQLA
jgi:hypothetical protein